MLNRHVTESQHPQGPGRGTFTNPHVQFVRFWKTVEKLSKNEEKSWNEIVEDLSPEQKCMTWLKSSLSMNEKIESYKFIVQL